MLSTFLAQRETFLTLRNMMRIETAAVSHHDITTLGPNKTRFHVEITVINYENTIIVWRIKTPTLR